MGIKLRVSTLLYRLKFKRKVKYLQSQFETEHLAMSNPPIPPPDINFNTDMSDVSDIFEYRAKFLNDAQQKQLPYLSQLANLNSGSATLDFGCGLGRLAAAFVSSSDNYGRYYGWEPESVARNWLKSAYGEDESVRIGGENLPTDLNYVTNEGNFKDKDSDSVSGESIRRGLKTLLHDESLTLSFSHSVFTHMWPNDAIETLVAINSIGTRDTIFVDTWLVVDEFAKNALENGHADRSLPYDVRGILTYSKSNPLVCTAYPIELLKHVYKSAGREIVDIQFGEWTGRSNFATYQDLVISRISAV